MKSTIEHRIESMVGKTFTYGNQIHYVEYYKLDEENEKLTVKTNLNLFCRLFEACIEFLNKWEPIISTNIQPVEQSLAVKMAEKDNKVADDLIKTLMDNIQKVTANKDFIAQATAINNNVNSILQVVKVKMQLAKQYKNG